jgi:hypothetical protein
METRLALFLAFTSVTLIMNTLLIWFMYKAFAGLTSRVTETMSEFERSGITRAWLNSMETAAQHAVSVTGATKQRMAEFDPVLERAQERYALALAQTDSKLENAAEQVSNGARKVRDVVAKPAFSAMAFVAGLSSALNSFDPEPPEPEAPEEPEE